MKYVCTDETRKNSECGTTCCYSCNERVACDKACWVSKNRCVWIFAEHEQKKTISGNNVNAWWENRERNNY